MEAEVPRGALVAKLVGNTLEFYDFLTYTFFAVRIGKAPLPTDSELAGLLLSVATLSIGFLTRPLGGIWIGAYADRLGRTPALFLTIGLMSIGAIGLVATPGYATIGIAAPLILVISRLIQGLALGGEVSTRQTRCDFSPSRGDRTDSRDCVNDAKRVLEFLMPTELGLAESVGLDASND